MKQNASVDVLFSYAGTVEIYTFLVELTYKCPLRCRHCYLGDLRKKTNFLSWEKLKKYLDEAVERGLLYLTLSGGEPLLYPHIENIVKWSSERGVLLRIYSSLYSLTPELAEILVSAPIYEVEASIYAASPQKHDAFTGVKGSFEKLLDGVKLLKENDIRVNLKFILHRENTDEIGGVVSLARELGVKLYASAVIIPCRDSCMPDVVPAEEHDLKKAFVSYPEVFGYTRRKNVLPLCGVQKAVFIDASGNVKRCMEHPEVLGNIHTSSPGEVFDSVKFKKAGEIALSLPQQCEGCGLVEWCRPCPAIATRGEVRTVKMFCKMAELRKEFSEK